MGDRNGRAAFRQFAQRAREPHLGERVDRRRCFVEDQHVRAHQRRAQERHHLALAGGEGLAALAHLGVEPVGEAVDPVFELEPSNGVLQLVVGGVGFGETQVVGDRVGEQERLLRHHGEPAAKVVVGNMLHVYCADGDASFRRVGQAGHEPRDGGLAGARLADERHVLPRRDRQRQRRQHVHRRFVVARFVGERHVVQRHPEPAGGQRNRVGGRRRPDGSVENAQHAPQSGDGGLRLVDHLGELGDGLEKPVREEHEADERASGEPGCVATPYADADHRHHREHAEHLARRKQQCSEKAGTNRRLRAFLRGGFDALQRRLDCVVGLQRLHARHRLADRRKHRGVAFAHAVVRAHQATLHEAQHDDERCHHRERHDRQHPVVGDHDARDHEHERKVEHPRQSSPGEEHRERLDVARHAGHQRAATLVVLVGEAQSMDVVEQPHPQPVQPFFRRGAQAEHRHALACRREQHDHGSDRAGTEDEVESHSPVDETFVDRLLDDDRNRHAPRRPEQSEHESERETAAERRCLGDALSDGVHRAAAADLLCDVVSEHRQPAGRVQRLG